MHLGCAGISLLSLYFWGEKSPALIEEIAGEQLTCWRCEDTRRCTACQCLGIQSGRGGAAVELMHQEIAFSIFVGEMQLTWNEPFGSLIPFLFNIAQIIYLLRRREGGKKKYFCFVTWFTFSSFAVSLWQGTMCAAHCVPVSCFGGKYNVYEKKGYEK